MVAALKMHESMVIPQDHQSIFGDTIHGVPNPNIPHNHPYPTRFHGPIYYYPRFFLPYQEQSYVAPNEYIGPTSVDGKIIPMPDGAGGFGALSQPALFGSATGSVLADALIGGAIGYAVAKKPGDRALWAGMGVAAGLLAGTLGLIGIVGAGLYVRKEG